MAHCTAQANEQEIRSTTMMGEIDVMTRAVKTRAKVTHARCPHTHGHLKTGYLNPVSPLLISVSLRQTSDAKAKATNLLLAAKSNSKALQQLAEIGILASPSAQFKAMIQKLVFRLVVEQKDEDDH